MQAAKIVFKVFVIYSCYILYEFASRGWEAFEGCGESSGCDGAHPSSLVNVGGFLADDWVAQEVGAELHDCASGADLGAFGGDGEVGVFAGLQCGAGEGDRLTVDDALRVAGNGGGLYVKT